MSETPEIRKGLAGVVADTSAISKVNSETNSLLYRGYPVQELAGHRDVEDVAYLLWNGELPSPDERARFDAFDRAHRALPEQVVDGLDGPGLDARETVELEGPLQRLEDVLLDEALLGEPTRASGGDGRRLRSRR